MHASQRLRERFAAALRLLPFLLLPSTPVQAGEPFAVSFYNVENLFDCTHDSLRNDHEFLPQGTRHWHPGRYQQKLHHIARVLTTINSWNHPAVVGLAEVENDSCLTRLTQQTMRHLNYRFVHHESADPRGIDCALLYRPDRFSVLESRPLRPVGLSTRDVLYVKGLADHSDTLHLYICHLPSRRGGSQASEARRISVATLIRQHVDSIVQQDSTAAIIVMGDMNDQPQNASMKLLARGDTLVNLMLAYDGQDFGTIKYQGQWSVFDQMLVSPALLNPRSAVSLLAPVSIHAPAYLLEADDQHLGQRPRRTYQGYSWHGGYSDHLPLLLQLKTNQLTYE